MVRHRHAAKDGNADTGLILLIEQHFHFFYRRRECFGSVCAAATAAVAVTKDRCSNSANGSLYGGLNGIN
jgi:hypothetical protein